MQNTKKSMLASGLAVLVCVAMLIGTTFAWFTDSVTNSGNTIKAGSLAIDANAYDIGEGGLTVTGLTDIAPATVTFEENGQNLKQDATPILTEGNWEPGQSSAKLLKLKNSGTLNAKVQLNFDISGDLTDALWYDFVQVNPESGAAIGQCTKRAMATLPELAAARELTLAPGAEVAFVFAYGMNTDAGNDYQNGTFQANVSIAAKQAPVEKDGFANSRYDENAVYPIILTTSEEFVSALATVTDGSQLVLHDDIESKKDLDFRNVSDVTMDFNEKTVNCRNDNIVIRVIGSDDKMASVTLSNGTIFAGSGTYCTLGARNASATLNNMVLKNITSYGCSVKAFPNSVINLNNVQSSSYMGGSMEAVGGTINVNGGTYTQTGKYDHNSCFGAVSSNTGTLNVTDMTATGENYGFYIFSSGGTINVYSGTFKADTVLKADLDLESYPTAEGVINIYGGSFDGKIDISNKCTMHIEAGTFANTGLTIEQFRNYTAADSTVTESNGVFTVVKG